MFSLKGLKHLHLISIKWWGQPNLFVQFIVKLLERNDWMSNNSLSFGVNFTPYELRVSLKLQPKIGGEIEVVYRVLGCVCN